MEARRRKQTKKESHRRLIEGWKKDFQSFAKELDVIDKDGNRIRVQASPILRALESQRTGRDYVLKPRQVFMTTWELARDIWWMIVNPGAKVTVVCQSDKDQSAVKAISDRISIMLGTDDAAKADPEAKHGLLGKYPELAIVQQSSTMWRYGASLLSIVGAGATEKSASKKGRSGTIHRLHVTEVAFFEYADETLTAMLQCVPPRSPNNEIIFESTPLGAAGYFYEKYQVAKTGANGFKAHFFQWFAQPEYRAELSADEKIEPKTEREKELTELYKISPEQLKWYRFKVADQGQAKVDQEFPTDEETCWLFEGRLFFDREALSKHRLCCRKPLATKFGGALRIWKKAEPNKSYAIGADPSNGVGGDPVSATVIDRDTGEHVASLHGQFTADSFGERLALLGVEYNWALIVLERSSSYQAVLNTLADWKRPGGEKSGTGYPNVFHDNDQRPGFKVSGMSRPAMLDALEEAVRKPPGKGGFFTYDEEFIKEAFLFVVTDEKPQAAPGAHDDRIMSTALAWSQVGDVHGLDYTAFQPAPSIAFEEVPAAFEGAPVLEQARGIGIIDYEGLGGNDFDGF